MAAKACIISVTAVSDCARDVAKWRAQTGRTPEHKWISGCTACSAAAMSGVAGMQIQNLFTAW
jgi:hypothetical protein